VCLYKKTGRTSGDFLVNVCVVDHQPSFSSLILDEGDFELAIISRRF
jgi:hypothetical protein